jgi:hypothetical protein
MLDAHSDENATRVKKHLCAYSKQFGDGNLDGHGNADNDVSLKTMRLQVVLEHIN